MEQNNETKNNFHKLLKTYLSMTGTSIAQMADGADVSQRSMTYYLNNESGDSELGSTKLSRCLDFFSVDTDHYWKTIELAKKVAVNLNKHAIYSDITHLDKEVLSKLSGCSEVNLFYDIKIEDIVKYIGHDVDDNQLLAEVAKAGIVDVTSTYVYFKQLVTYFLNAGVDDKDAVLTPSDGARAKKKIVANVEKNAKDGKHVSEDFYKKVSEVAQKPTKMGASPLFSALPMVGSIMLAAAGIALGLLMSDDDKVIRDSFRKKF